MVSCITLLWLSIFFNGISRAFYRSTENRFLESNLKIDTGLLRLINVSRRCTFGNRTVALSAEHTVFIGVLSKDRTLIQLSNQCWTTWNDITVAKGSGCLSLDAGCPCPFWSENDTIWNSFYESPAYVKDPGSFPTYVKRGCETVRIYFEVSGCCAFLHL